MPKKDFIEIGLMKKLNPFEDIKDLINAAVEYGYKCAYRTYSDEVASEESWESAFNLGYGEGERTKTHSCSNLEDDEVETEYDEVFYEGFSEGYNEGYVQGHKKGYIACLKNKDEDEEWCECRELGFSEGIDHGYVHGYKDELLGIPSWIHDEEIEELIKQKKR